jgi:cardiolipin synthase
MRLSRPGLAPRAFDHALRRFPFFVRANASLHGPSDGWKTGTPPKCNDGSDEAERDAAVEDEAHYSLAGFRVRRANVNLPNALTVARILASPPLALLYLNGHHKAAVAGFLAAGALDWWDGYLARKWDQRTVLGAMLDPVADKILVASLALPMAYTGALPSWLVALIVGRDVGLVAGGFWHRFQTRSEGAFLFDTREVNFTVEPTFVSKCNTAGQIALVSGVLASSAFGVPHEAALTWLGYGVGVTTVWSGAEYAMMLWRDDAFKDRSEVR